jgi:uncharacterized membrane protein
MQWWYAQNGKQIGPVEEDALFALAREGKLEPADLVWNSGMGNEWKPASGVPGLFPEPAAAPAATPAAILAGMQAARNAAHAGETPNAQLMAEARQNLSGSWGLGVLLCVVFMLVVVAASMIPFGSVIVTGPMTVGLALCFLSLIRGQAPEFGSLFDGFRSFGPALAAYLLMTLFVFLWLLPCFAAMAGGAVLLYRKTAWSYPGSPGVALVGLGYAAAILGAIVLQLRYSMLFFVLADNPDIGPLDALRTSVGLMEGRKWKLFCLWWRFFGWVLLSVLSCGIGFLWLAPYMTASIARFYDDLLGAETAA